MSIDFRNSIASPLAVDIGNKTTQKQTVSKTVKFAMLTNNENAVRAARETLRKESYPFAVTSIVVNRDLFRLQVGDVFLYSNTNYGISNAIYRVLQIEEANLESENITIHAMEDVFGISSVITAYTKPPNNRTPPPSYGQIPLASQAIIEVPYAMLMDDPGIIPLAARSTTNQTGALLYISNDSGDSYASISTIDFSAYGELVREYPADTTQIDEIGMIVDFSNTDIALFENLTRQDLLGVKNLAIVDDEIMTIQTITPDEDVDDRYYLTGVYRGRFDTKRERHPIGSGIFITNGDQLKVITNSGIVAEAAPSYKFTPFNSKTTLSIGASLVTYAPVLSRSRIPYNISNFKANSRKTDPVYYDDIVLSWSPRVRGEGAGYYNPAVTDQYSTWEGYFEIEVYVDDVLVRTKLKVDDFTWTYTEAMNLSDNTNLASEVTFKIVNHIDYEEWSQAVSEQSEITVRKG